MSLEGPIQVNNSGLVFYCDVSNPNSYRGEPTVNTAGSRYSYVWANGVVVRDSAGPSIPPPITGQEIASLRSTDGQETQTILYTAGVDQVNGGVYTHSAYIYLVSGTWVSVGQHWNPWNYGVPNYLTPGVWTKVSYTLTNTANNYGAVALSYNTNGMIYVTASQYEKKSYSTPYVSGTRSNTGGLLDLTGNNSINLAYAGFDNNGAITYNGSNYYIDCSVTKTASCTFSCWAKTTTLASNPMLFNAGPNGTGPDLFFYNNKISWNLWDGDSNPLTTTPASVTDGNWHNYVLVNDSTSTAKLYYDGVLLGSAVYRSAASTNTLKIGGEPAGYLWNGSIGLFTVHNRALTATEILKNFNSLRSRYNV